MSTNRNIGRDIPGMWFDAAMLARAKKDNLDLTLLRAAVVDNRPQWGMRRGYVYANTDGTRPYTRFFHMRRDGKVQESTVETRKIIESEPFVTNTPSEQLRLAKIAQSHAGETHCEGDPGFCDPLQAQWEETTLPPHRLRCVCRSASSFEMD